MNERIEAWLRLRDAKRFQTDSRQSGQAARKMGDDIAAGGAKARTAGRDYGGLERSMGAVGRAGAVAGLAAATGLGIAGTMGIKFNATMEQNEVSFTNFLGSTKKAKAYLNDLYGIASKTPFEFPELVGAARRFLAFGFSAKETKKTLLTVGDAVSAIGGGSAEIERMTMALGQIKAKGKLSTEELLQMAELGIPVFDILRKEFNMTGEELEDALRTGAIGADKGIAAITKGMDSRFKGSAKEQSKTFLGQWSTFKDIANQKLGELSKPMFNFMRDTLLPGMTAALPKIAGVAKTVGGFLSMAFGKGKQIFKDVIATIKPAMPFFENVLIPLLIGIGEGVLASIVMAAKVAIPILKIFFKALGWIGTVLKPLKGFFRGLGQVIGIVFTGPILRLVGLVGKLGGVFKIFGLAAKGVGLYISFLAKAFGFVLKAYLKVGKGFAKAAGFLLSPIKNAFVKIFSFLTGLYAKFFGIGVKMVSKLVSGLKGIGKAIVGVFKKGAGIAGDIGRAIATWLNAHTPLGDRVNLPSPLPDFTMPSLAAGGVLSSGGLVEVGEFGREVVRLPAGASVHPLSRPAKASALAPGGGKLPSLRGGTVIAKVFLGRKQIAEAVAEEAEDEVARR